MKPRMLIRQIYDYGLAPLMMAGYRAWALKDEKARAFFEIRRGMMERLAVAEKPGGRTVLFHVASVGELLQAMPVMAAMKETAGAPTVALSYTSPSVARNMPKGVRADIVTPSPLDTRSEVRRFLEVLAPGLIVFSTYDLWPNLVWEAADRGVHLVLINASLPEGAGRLGFPARGFYRGLYSRLRAVGAITDDDGRRHLALGVGRERVSVTGNCRFDQTLARCRSVAADDPDLAVLPEAEFLLVAGSTWPEDHRCLLPALDQLLARHEGLTAVIAPHEPSPAHVAELEGFFSGRGRKVARYTLLRSGGSSAGARVVVVDTVGVLYKLYRKGHAAYVGGSFRQGVHNVMEPAGMGLPVVIGPVHRNSAEALEMLRSGAAVTAGDEAGLAAALGKFIADPDYRRQTGQAALAAVERNAGATARTMEMLKEFL
jgi:3-deoxy-D-manno-octulosonic-acid transferase